MADGARGRRSVGRQAESGTEHGTDVGCGLWQLQVSRSAARLPIDGMLVQRGAGTGRLPADGTMFGTEPETDERTKAVQQRIPLRARLPPHHLSPLPHA